MSEHFCLRKHNRYADDARDADFRGFFFSMDPR